jgi:hypothetical protein
MKITKIHMLERADAQSQLTLTCEIDGKTQELIFPRETVAELLLGILGMQRPQSGRPVDIPAILAEGASPFQQQNCSGLAFFLSGGWMLPIAIPPHAIPRMKQTLDDLELLAKDVQGRS